MEDGQWRELLGTTLRTLYQTDPVAYAHDVLKVKWNEKIEEAVWRLLKYRKQALPGGHKFGKSHLGGGLVNWYFDCFEPSVTIVTAPKLDHINKVIFKEVRNQRRGRPGLLPKASEMRIAENHYASGQTASTGEGFQGQHSGGEIEEGSVFLLFDESVGIHQQYYDSGGTMVQSPTSLWQLYYNPTDASSPVYVEEKSGRFDVVRLNVMEHPNIVAEMKGEPPPIAGAVRLSWVEGQIMDPTKCTPVSKAESKKTDIEWRGSFYRPGPEFEARVLARWPTNPTEAVWSEALFEACVENRLPLIKGSPLVIGCDVARKGKNDTAIAIRQGASILHIEWANGWGTDQTAGRIKALIREYARPGEDIHKVPVFIDDAGVGGGVVDQAEGFNFIGIGAGTKANDTDKYDLKRSELWFTLQECAMRGEVDFSRLGHAERLRLNRELLAPRWKLNKPGQRVVEDKDITAERLKGGSPDVADAVNLCYCDPPSGNIITVRSGLRERLNREKDVF